MDSNPEKPKQRSAWLRVLIPVALILARSVVVAPLAGVAIGAVIGLAAFLPYGYDPLFAMQEGMLMGFAGGLVLGTPAGLLFYKAPTRTCLLYLGCGTLVGGFMGGVAGGPGLALMLGLTGYVVGLILLAGYLFAD
jgi:hypothetical protein